MHTQPTTTTEQTTWLELAFTPEGTKLAILTGTPNQVAHEYRAYDQQRDDHLITRVTRDRDGATLSHAFRADVLDTARLTITPSKVLWLTVSATRTEIAVRNMTDLTPLFHDIYVDELRKFIDKAKGKVNA